MNNDEITYTKRQLKREQKLEMKHQKRLRKELLKSEERRRRNELYSVQLENPKIHWWKEHITTTKLLIFLIILNCTVIEIYSMVVMFVLSDLSALYTLITTVVGESVTFGIYCLKSYKENNSNKTIQLERDKFGLSQEDCENIKCPVPLTAAEQELLDKLNEDEIPDDDDHEGDIPDDEEEIIEETNEFKE